MEKILHLTLKRKWMENRNEPMGASQWLKENNKPTPFHYSTEAVNILMQEYADYIKSFQPASVENGEINKIALLQILTSRLLGAFDNEFHKHEYNRLSYAIEALKELVPPSNFDGFGASITRPTDNSVACDFAIWTDRSPYSYNPKLDLWEFDMETITTTELYTIFLNQKDKK